MAAVVVFAHEFYLTINAYLAYLEHDKCFSEIPFYFYGFLALFNIALNTLYQLAAYDSEAQHKGRAS